MLATGVQKDKSQNYSTDGLIEVLNLSPNVTETVKMLPSFKMTCGHNGAISIVSFLSAFLT